MKTFSALRGAFLLGASLVTLSTAHAQSAKPAESEESPAIVPTTGVDPNGVAPNGLLDIGINGVGQMRTITNLTTRTGFVCSGSLINPRTVLFAAHCVNGQAANTYGFNTGGTPISFGFQADNLVARRLWAGFSATGQFLPADANIYQTNVGNAIYSGEHVWYDPRSLLPANAGFINSDIALVTLDTPANDIPTWAMLFTPLTSPTHGVITGYGATGTTGTSGANLGVDSRRRIAENMIDFLGSLDDRNNWLFCPGSTSCPFGALPQSLYQLDFDSPSGQPAYNPALGAFDFDLFDGAALPNEGTTAGGDSGGPLIADQAFDKPVVVGVLSGGSRFFGPQPFSSYGTSSFYQPLFLYWDLIVANNPYKYVTNLSGSRDWTDPAHWLQTMDPNYVVERNGQLVNALPGSLGGETSTDTTKFGTVCFLDDCLNIDRIGPENAGTGAGLVVAGGPGSTNFVPNNRRADPRIGVRPLYYDVTLSAAGTTSATTAIEIDRLTIDGATKLDVKSSGNLRVLGDFTQISGWTNVNGLLKTGEALVATGILSGSGTIDPTFLTVIGGFVAPGGADKVGTLTVKGDVILASASALFIDATRGSADRLTVLSDANNAGILAINDATLVMSKFGAAPRHGEAYTIASAAGGIDGTFSSVFSFQGVLRPDLAYNPTDIVATLRAGSLAVHLGRSTASAQAFANALDTLRTSSYTSLYNLFGAVDLMDSAQLGATLDSLAPRVLGESELLQDRQSRLLMSYVTDRLSLGGTGAAQGMTVIGNSRGFAGEVTGEQAGLQAFAGLAPAGTAPGKLPDGVTGFIAAGTSTGESSYGSSARLGGGRSGNWMGMGLEFRTGDRTTIGTAIGYASATSRPGSDRVNSRTMQAAAYATRELGGGVYLGAVANMEIAHLDSDRTGFSGTGLLELTGATEMRRLGMMAEAGKAFTLGDGLSFTPRVRLGYDRQDLAGFRERGGETALAIDSFTRERIEAKLGFALAGSTGVGNGWRLAPQLQADVSRRLAGSGGNVTVRFANAPEAGIALPLAGSARTWAEARAAISLDNGVVAFSAGGETAFGAGYRDDRALAGLTVRF